LITKGALILYLDYSSVSVTLPWGEGERELGEEALPSSTGENTAAIALLPSLPADQMSASILLTLSCCLEDSLYLPTNHIINSGSSVLRISARFPLYKGT
jgi:hypothetical protein